MNSPTAGATPLPNYATDEATRFVADLDPLTWSRRTSAARWLTRMVDTAEALRPVLRQFPAVKYEPLEAHYALLRALGTLDEKLVCDLCHHLGWRGAAVAAWLALLQPCLAYAAPLRAGGRAAPGCHWITELAAAACEGRSVRDDDGLLPRVHRLRAVLDGVPRPRVPLRRYPNEAERAAFVAAQARVRATYRTGGLTQALALARKEGLLDGPR